MGNTVTDGSLVADVLVDLLVVLRSNLAKACTRHL
jgi:hypothetical protein